MARIAGVDIPNDKPVAYSLAYIYGIGRPSATKICAKARSFLCAVLRPQISPVLLSKKTLR